MYSVPTSLYDIYPNDSAYPDYVESFNGQFDMSTGELFHPQQPFDGTLAPAFPNLDSVSYHQPPDGGLAPAYQYNPAQMLPLFTGTPSSSSQSSSSFEATLTPSLGPSLENVPQLYPELAANTPQATAAPLAGSGPVSHRRRTRGPNRRPPGTGFSSLLDKLPTEVQAALNMYDVGCCKAKKEPSTTHKHMFSIKHINRFCKGMENLVPFFVCPAFVAFNVHCRNASAGRYDSAERHCRNCRGFNEINSMLEVFPVEVTMGEFRAIQEFRSTKNPSDETTRLASVAVSKLLAMMIGAGMPLKPKYDVSGAMNVTAAGSLEQRTSVLTDSADEQSRR